MAINLLDWKLHHTIFAVLYGIRIVMRQRKKKKEEEKKKKKQRKKSVSHIACENLVYLTRIEKKKKKKIR